MLFDLTKRQTRNIEHSTSNVEWKTGGGEDVLSPPAPMKPLRLAIPPALAAGVGVFAAALAVRLLLRWLLMLRLGLGVGGLSAATGDLADGEVQLAAGDVDLDDVDLRHVADADLLAGALPADD